MRLIAPVSVITAALKQLLKLRLDFGVEIFESLAAVTDHRQAEGLESFFADLDRTWNMQFHVRHKKLVKLFTSSATSAEGEPT